MSKSFKINLDINILHKFDTTLNGNVGIYLKHSYTRKVKKEDIEEDIEEKYWNLICAIKSRIYGTTEYLNLLSLGKNECGIAFDFLNFINNAQVLIDCIYKLSCIFNLEIKEEEAPNCIFSENNIENSSVKYVNYVIECVDKEEKPKKKYTDDEYFKYLRSLCSIHPIGTSHHKNYQKYDFELSPFITWGDGFISKKELILVVYNQNGNDYNRHIYIDEIFQYVKSKFEIIELIIEKMKEYVENKKSEFRGEKIKNIYEFNNYIDYISNLKIEYKSRGFQNGIYDFEYIENAVKQKISNSSNKNKVDLYIDALKYSITFLHQELQDLPDNFPDEKYSGIEYPDINNETNLLHNMTIIPNNKYDNYSIEKSQHLIDDSDDVEYQNSYRGFILRMPIFNDVDIKISGNESNLELYLLLQTALYIKAFDFDNAISRNMPEYLKPNIN